MGQSQCLVRFASLLCSDKQLDAAEEAASRAINLLPRTGNQLLACQSHRVLGEIYQRKGKARKAIHHFEISRGFGSSSSSATELLFVHCALSQLSLDEGRLDDAHAYLEQAKSHTANSMYNLGCVTAQQAVVLYRQDRLEEARSEALRAAEIYEKLGVATELEQCGRVIQGIQEELNARLASLFKGQSVGRVGFGLRVPVFSHGQLYAVLPRATSSRNVKTLQPSDQEHARTANVVYPEKLGAAEDA